VTVDEQKSAALLLWPERRPGAAGELPDGAVWPFPAARVPSLPTRFRQALRARSGGLNWETSIVEPLMRARRSALGDGAAGEPRVLVRVDEYPHARCFDPGSRFGDDGYRRFHEVLSEAGIPYLLAISPRVSRDYLDPAVDEDRGLAPIEEARLRELAADGVVFALHGRNHRTRYSSPRRRSEFCGLGTEAAAARIDAARAVFTGLGIETPVFVPPFNRFDASQYALLAERFDVVCGGPESTRLLGFHPTPEWWGDAAYLPSFPPLYGTAAQAQAGVQRLIDLRAALWSPLTLHWGWELEDDFASLRRLCQVLEGRAADWSEFITAVRSV
jgi:hypothetical protein